MLPPFSPHLALPASPGAPDPLRRTPPDGGSPPTCSGAIEIMETGCGLVMISDWISSPPPNPPPTHTYTHTRGFRDLRWEGFKPRACVNCLPGLLAPTVTLFRSSSARVLVKQERERSNPSGHSLAI